ncbi:MAG TPA: peptidase [Acidobacteriota bacterium]|nr:peptidase [Acidobacteriota bacterium]HNB74061.1 peptidase [Acidobacteriota bacterium]HND22285.1 peptidase [Acidobacteriota bacterium]HNH85242.1 peptidase [Acidobacteriota bacterium]
MTFCLGIAVQDGLIGIADTRITTGMEMSSSRKLITRQFENNALFLMTSGLRSTRDKAVMYFDEYLNDEGRTFDKLHKAVSAYCGFVRQVADEDQSSLSRSGLFFDLHTLIGGQFEKDETHKLYLVYPQGNWVEILTDTPFCIIGRSAYGKPLLDRMLTYPTSLEHALNIGFLAFDSTCTSVTEVDFPIDIALYRSGSFAISEHRFAQNELQEASEWWHTRLSELVKDVPSNWAKKFFSKSEAAHS